MVIWKFPLEVTDFVSVEMPLNAVVLSVDNQDGALRLWAMVEPDMPKDIRHFYIVGTGNPMPAGLKKFIGTVLMPTFVCHVFERKDAGITGGLDAPPE